MIPAELAQRRQLIGDAVFRRLVARSVPDESEDAVLAEIDLLDNGEYHVADVVE
jgi:hypothetical protein